MTISVDGKEFEVPVELEALAVKAFFVYAWRAVFAVPGDSDAALVVMWVNLGSICDVLVFAPVCLQCRGDCALPLMRTRQLAHWRLRFWA